MVSSSSRHRNGFTLVELSIVIIIVGLLTAGGLAVGSSMVERAAYIDTQKLISQIQQSLRDHYVVYGRLPCVARFTDAPGSATFGEEITTCTTSASAPGGTQRDASGNPPVRIGMVPVRTLGLPDSAAQDKYGNRIIYAVTEMMTSAADFGAVSGGITVKDASDNDILTDAVYFLASTGRDRKGGYTYKTASIPTTCGSSDNLDVLNCTLTTAEFRDAPYNNGDVEDMFFDDITSWAPKFHFTATDTESNSLWAASGNNIYSVGTDGNTSTTNVGIGTASPQAGVHIDMGNRALRLEGDTHTFMEYYPTGPAIRGAYTGFGSAASDSFTIRNEIDGADINLLPSGAGRVGIGTTDPQNLLEVNGYFTAGCCIGLYNPSTTAGKRMWRMVVNTSDSDFYLGYRTDDNKANIAAGTNSVSPFHIENGAPHLFLNITESGRLGVNTNSPTGMLMIDAKVPDSSTMIEALRLARNGPYGQFMTFSLGHAGHLFTTFSETDNAKPLVFNNTTNSAGSTPTAGFNHIYFRIRNDNKFTINQNGNASLAGSLSQGSDIRLKADITPLTDVFHKLDTLQGVSYRWNGKGGHTDTNSRYMGLLAQDVQKVFPEAVSEDDAGYLALDYSAMTAPLLEAVKLLHAENTAQAARIAELESRAGITPSTPVNLRGIDKWLIGGLVVMLLGMGWMLATLRRHKS